MLSREGMFHCVTDTGEVGTGLVSLMAASLNI